MVDEYTSIMTNDVGDIVPISEWRLVAISRWILKRKHVVYGNIDKSR